MAKDTEGEAVMPQEMKPELRECPFCGAEPSVDSLPSGSAWCHIHTQSMSYNEWNRRSAPSAEEAARDGALEEEQRFERLARAALPFVDVVRTSSGRIPTEKLSAAHWHELVKAYEEGALTYLYRALGSPEHAAPSPDSGADGMPDKPWWWWASGSVGKHEPGKDYQVVEKADYDALRQWALRRPAPRDAGWVRVKERLPSSPGKYWCVVQPDDGPEYPPYTAICWWHHEKKWKHFEEISDETFPLHNGEQVTHWMPLPAAPNEERG